MATQVNGRKSTAFSGAQLTTYNITCITSGTTVTLTLPPGTKVRFLSHYNTTTGAFVAAGTYVQSTGVWTSGTVAVNDVIEVSFITDTAI